VEISFHAGIIEFLNIPGPDIISAIRDAIPDGLEVRIFMGMLRNQYTELMAPVIDDCVNWEDLDGIDLHGTEVLPLEDWAKSLWSRAREANKFTKAHAGEFGGPDYVKDAVEFLGVNRVEHGVRAVEDHEVLSLVIDRDITFDVCPISNLKLNVVETMKNHPIRKLFDEGVRCTLNTDDPLSFGNQLEEEYAALAMELKFSKKELAILARNGFEIALMPESMKLPFINQIDAIIGSN
jgi:adenosine deaminase